MSFSFSAHGATIEEVLTDVGAKMAEVVSSQPVHEVDAETVKKVAALQAALLQQDETRDIAMSVSGSVSWRGQQGADDFAIIGASVNVSAHLAER